MFTAAGRHCLYAARGFLTKEVEERLGLTIPLEPGNVEIEA